MEDFDSAPLVPACGSFFKSGFVCSYVQDSRSELNLPSTSNNFHS